MAGPPLVRQEIVNLGTLALGSVCRVKFIVTDLVSCPVLDVCK